jgi:hypothetical protein
MVLLLAGLATQAAAQGASTVTINLFSNPIAAPSGLQANAQTFGMRPETVGAVSYFALSPEAVRMFQAQSGKASQVRIALSRDQEVVCELSRQTGSGDTVSFSGEPVGGELGGNCNLVVENGSVSGLVDTAKGRYRIVPLGTGNAHAVVQIKTDAFPNESAPLQR